MWATHKSEAIKNQEFETNEDFRAQVSQLLLKSAKKQQSADNKSYSLVENQLSQRENRKSRQIIEISIKVNLLLLKKLKQTKNTRCKIDLLKQKNSTSGENNLKLKNPLKCRLSKLATVQIVVLLFTKATSRAYSKVAKVQQKPYKK